MKILIEVSGGLVQNITATDEISIYLIDHDNLEAGSGTEDARQAQQPNYICDDGSFQKELDRVLSEHEQ